MAKFNVAEIAFVSSFGAGVLMVLYGIGGLVSLVNSDDPEKEKKESKYGKIVGGGVALSVIGVIGGLGVAGRATDRIK